MSTGTWHSAAIAGLLAATLASCAHEKRAKTAHAAPAAPQPAQQQAAQQPPQRQQELMGAQRRLEAAHQDVVKAQQQLALAQQREEQERAKVQQLEIQARQDLERASQLALQAEQAQGLQAATGRIAQATPSRVLLQLADGRVMSFNVDDRTRVLVGSEQRSVSDIQQGADARVAYDPKGDERTAITIRLAPVERGMGVTPPSPASPAPSEPWPRR
jgi:methionine-rich copper-binding protein CopC